MSFISASVQTRGGWEPYTWRRRPHSLLQLPPRMHTPAPVTTPDLPHPRLLSLFCFNDVREIRLCNGPSPPPLIFCISWLSFLVFCSIHSLSILFLQCRLFHQCFSMIINAFLNTFQFPLNTLFYMYIRFAYSSTPIFSLSLPPTHLLVPPYFLSVHPIHTYTRLTYSHPPIPSLSFPSSHADLQTLPFPFPLSPFPLVSTPR